MDSLDFKAALDLALLINPNRYSLTLAAARRAREIQNGDTPRVPPLNKNKPDKPAIAALREIAAKKTASF